MLQLLRNNNSAYVTWYTLTDVILTFYIFTSWQCQSPAAKCSIVMVIPLFKCWETKSTPSYTQLFKTCRCANAHYVFHRTDKNNWFESDYNIRNLCDNTNVKFHCFNPRKKQLLNLPWPGIINVQISRYIKVISLAFVFVSHTISWTASR